MRRLTGSVGMTVLALSGAALLGMGAIRAQTLLAQAQAQVQGAAQGAAQPVQGQGTPGQAAGGRAGQGGRGAPVPGGRGGPPPVPRKHLLVIGMTRGFHHGSTSNAVATFWKLGKESAVWDTEIKTDMEWVTKKPAGTEAHNLDWFDALALVNTTGDWKLDGEQKKALLAFVHDDGKGLVLAHAALDANYGWPEYAEMVGGWFQAHPWGTFDAPVIVEDPTFPAMRHFPARLFIHDEMYSPKNWSRDKVNVLMRLDESQLDYTKPQPNSARADKDQAIAWSKMYGKGRVFYSSLGHTNEAWENPDVQKMYLEAVKWAMRRTEGSTTAHAKVN
ncbi:MAG: ThuA domain-containing protein [Acidobacteriia bacterium]|nr:ThuA domain-containing protein [Terriglobia bacterium]